MHIKLASILGLHMHAAVSPRLHAIENIGMLKKLQLETGHKTKYYRSR